MVNEKSSKTKAKIKDRIASQVIEGDCHVRNFQVLSNLDTKVIAGLRSRNNPIVPPKQTSIDIMMEVEFTGASGVAKLRTILADFQASFCQPIYHDKLMPFLSTQVGDDFFLEEIAELERFIDKLKTSRKPKDVLKLANASDVYPIIEYEILEGNEGISANTISVKIRVDSKRKSGNPEYIDRYLTVIGLYDTGDEDKNAYQKQCIKEYLENHKDSIAAVFFAVEGYLPESSSRFHVGDVILYRGGVDKYPTPSHTFLTLSEYVILRMRQRYGHYQVAFQEGINNDPYSDTNVHAVVKQVQDYALNLSLLPRGSTVKKYSLYEFVDRLDKIDREVPAADINNATLNKTNKVFEDLYNIYLEALKTYRVGKAQTLSGYIPVVLSRMDITFNPNAVLSVIARFHFKFFHFLPFIDRFEFINLGENNTITTVSKPEESNLYVNYRDRVFLDSWIERTLPLDKYLAKKLKKFLQSSNKGTLSNLFEQYINFDNFEIEYTVLPESLNETGLPNYDSTIDIPADSETIRTGLSHLQRLTTAKIPIVQEITSIEEVVWNREWYLADLPILGYRFPVYQYMGASAVALRIVFRTKDVSFVTAMRDLNDYVMNVYRQTNNYLASKGVVIKNDFLNLFDVSTIMPLRIEVSPVPGSVNEYYVSMEAITSDVDKDEHLSLLRDSGIEIRDLAELNQIASELSAKRRGEFSILGSVWQATKAALKYIGRQIDYARSSDEDLRNNVRVLTKRAYDNAFSSLVIEKFLRYIIYFRILIERLHDGIQEYPSTYQLRRLIATDMVGMATEELDAFIKDVVNYDIIENNGIDDYHLRILAQITSMYILNSYSRKSLGLSNNAKRYIVKLQHFINYVFNNIRSLEYNFPGFEVGDKRIPSLISDLPYDPDHPDFVGSNPEINIYPDLSLPKYKDIVGTFRSLNEDDFVNRFKALLTSAGFNIIIYNGSLDYSDNGSVIIRSYESDKAKAALEFFEEALYDSDGNLLLSYGIPLLFWKEYKPIYDISVIQAEDAPSELIYSIRFGVGSKRRPFSEILKEKLYNSKQLDCVELLREIMNFSSDPAGALFALVFLLEHTDKKSVLNEARKLLEDFSTPLSFKSEGSNSYFIPDYLYYGVTPPPGSLWNTQAKTIDDYVDPGFFMYDSILTKESFSEKDIIKATVESIDSGESNIDIFKKIQSEVYNREVSEVFDASNSVTTETRSDGDREKTTEKPKNSDVGDAEPPFDPGYFQNYKPHKQLSKMDIYDYDGRTRARYDVKDSINHMVSYNRSMSRAYPTAMIWFVEEDSEELYAFDDLYQYTAIDSIEIIKHKMIADRAIVRVSNVSGVLSQDRFVVIDQKLYDKLKNKIPEGIDLELLDKIDLDSLDFGTLEGFQDKIKVTVGTKVIIKLGYTATERLLPKVFIGRITAIRGGPLLEFEVGGLELETFKPYAGSWGNMSMPWIAHSQLKDKRDFSRPLGLNIGLLRDQVPKDDPLSGWYNLLGGHVYTFGTLGFMAGAIPAFALGTPVLWALGLGFAIGLALATGSAVMAHKTTYGIDDTDDTINIFVNKKPWLLGFNWLHWDINWLCENEPTFYNLNKLSKYTAGMIATTKYLDHGGTFYIGPPSGRYIYTRRIPTEELEVHRRLMVGADYRMRRVLVDFVNMRQYDLFKKINSYYAFTPSLKDLLDDFIKHLSDFTTDTNVLNIINRELCSGSSVDIQKLDEILHNPRFIDHLDNTDDYSRFDFMQETKYVSQKMTSDERTTFFANVFLYKDKNLLENRYPFHASIREFKSELYVTINDEKHCLLQFFTPIESSDLFSTTPYVAYRCYVNMASVLRIVEALGRYLDEKINAKVIPKVVQDNRYDLNTKPLRKIHFISSWRDIIANNIYTTTDEMANTVRISTEVEDFKDGGDLFELCLDANIPTMKRIIRNVVDPRFTPGMVATIRSILGDGQGIMMWAACNYLADAIKPMYRGELVIVGRPEIEPYDLVYLADVHNNMGGKFEVESVTHLYSKEYGFITVITPHLLTAIADKGSVFKNMALSMGCTVLTLGTIALTIIGSSVMPLFPAIVGLGASMIVSKINGWGLWPNMTGQGIISEKMRNPVSFFPLQYKGVPYVAGVDGLQRTGYFDIIANRWVRTWVGAGRALDHIRVLGQKWWLENVLNAVQKQVNVNG